MFDPDPPVSADDTQPRAPVITTVERIDATPESPRRGCANPLLLAFVTLSFMGLCIAIVGLAGVAGYRDGGNDAATHAAGTRVAAISTQLPHIAQDMSAGNWDSAWARCAYVGTLQPGNPVIANCLTQAAVALSATASPTETSQAATPATSATFTPTSAPAGTSAATAVATITNLGDSTFSPQAAFARAQEELRKNNLEAAVSYLEAIRELAPTFDTTEVTTTLCSSYESLGNQYQADLRLSQMVVVINKALDMNCQLADKSWAYTVNVAQLYLDAKSALDSGDYARADRVYNKLAPIALNYLDTKTLACQAFDKAGDTASKKQYC